jgi:hypothetical protein
MGFWHGPSTASPTLITLLGQEPIFPDSDGNLALDFLGEEVFKRDVEAQGILIKSLPKAYQFVRAAQMHWRGQNDSKLAVRYDMLWNYFRLRAHIWGTEIRHLADELDHAC